MNSKNNLNSDGSHPFFQLAVGHWWPDPSRDILANRIATCLQGITKCPFISIFTHRKRDISLSSTFHKPGAPVNPEAAGFIRHGQGHANDTASIAAINAMFTRLAQVDGNNLMSFDDLVPVCLGTLFGFFLATINTIRKKFGLHGF